MCSWLVHVQLGKSLEAELKLAKINNVGIHNLSPGMVTTELLMSGANTSAAKFFINCLGRQAALGRNSLLHVASHWLVAKLGIGLQTCICAGAALHAMQP
jgi:hypothetical protein